MSRRSISSLGLTLLVAGCGGGGGGPVVPSGAKDNSLIPMNAKLDDVPPSVLAQKLRPLFPVVKALTQRSHDSRARYLSWADERKGPSASARNIYGLFELGNGATRLKEAIASAEKKPPRGDSLMEPVRKFEAALEQYEPLINEAKLYYERKDYLDDGMKRGKQLHEKLMLGLNAICTDSEAANAEVNRLIEVWHRKSLKMVEASKDDIEYLVRNMYQKASEAAKVATETGEVDLADRLSPKVDEFIKALDELSKEIRSNSSTYGKFQTIETAGQMFAVEIKERMRRFRQVPHFSAEELRQLKTPSGWVVPGAPIRIRISLSSLQEVYFNTTY